MLFGNRFFENTARADRPLVHLPWLDGVTACEEYRSKLKERYGQVSDFGKLSQQQKDEISESIRIGCSERFAHCNFSMCRSAAVESSTLPSWVTTEMSCQQFIQEVKARYGNRSAAAPLSSAERQERDMVLDLACTERFSTCGFLSCKRSEPMQVLPESSAIEKPPGESNFPEEAPSEEAPPEEVPLELAQPEAPPEPVKPPSLEQPDLAPEVGQPEPIPVDQTSSATGGSDIPPEILPSPDPVTPDPGAINPGSLLEESSEDAVSPEAVVEEGHSVDMSVWEKKLQKKREGALTAQHQQTIVEWKAKVESRNKIRKDKIKAQKAREAEKRIIWDRMVMPDMARPKKPKPPPAPLPPSISTGPIPQAVRDSAPPGQSPTQSPTPPVTQQPSKPGIMPPQLQNLLPPGPNYLPPSPPKRRKREE